MLVACEEMSRGAVLLVVGNGAVLAVTSRWRPASRLKPPELLSVNLGGSLTWGYPLSVTSSWTHRWVGGNPSCLYYGLMGFLFRVASIATLTATSPPPPPPAPPINS
ncbi:hypothetical protein SKAU_G00183090 [Synaphobranchus kaupii]|uniref:Uncharacterized protein n=1 Tax=Synaphobranchus kaupii TaxID=118154 RepID=A0A9Q1FBZ0_SYNKA|nr:hypothetical protein SKAU_G00183090 [Synaphobranchus kaupii]